MHTHCVSYVSACPTLQLHPARWRRDRIRVKGLTMPHFHQAKPSPPQQTPSSDHFCCQQRLHTIMGIASWLLSLLGLYALLLGALIFNTDWHDIGRILLLYAAVFFISARVLYRRRQVQAPTHTQGMMGMVLLLFLYLPALFSGLCLGTWFVSPAPSNVLSHVAIWFWSYQHWGLMALLASYVVYGVWRLQLNRRTRH
ncbi:hypothetical protein LVJ82_05985 [Vitreoscilla massiliensis]|uniref:Uncharacterized protein n=1 Tax=Vitreoscilla massiliensis TaxID=1689272 RepID=A0ABY4EAS5_9NEIS|nr:hypothetical protein [Vitreoscilla massiliensis]UOO90522.1 hypothetical protein LVJ82_05985 [Vitreoscilla massiliensis]